MYEQILSHAGNFWVTTQEAFRNLAAGTGDGHRDINMELCTVRRTQRLSKYLTGGGCK